MLFKLAFKNVVSRKSSYVIILFMSFAVLLFCLSNAIFDSTEDGVQANYVSSFTGDLIVRPKGGQNSLFGDETPVTGSLTKLTLVAPYNDICSYLESCKFIKAYTEQLSGAAAMEYNGGRTAAYLFGVNGQQYMDLMSTVHVIEGRAFTSGEKGLMVSDVTAQSTGIHVGDTVQFTVADGPYFRIRAVPVTGIYKYDIHNDIFKRFVLIDPSTMRSLMEISDVAVVADEEIDEEKQNLLADDLDWDAMFEDADALVDAVEFDDDFDDAAPALVEPVESTDAPLVEPVETTDAPLVEPVETTTDFEDLSEVSTSSTNEVLDDGTAWNNLIVRLYKGSAAKRAIRRLNRHFKKMGWPVEAVGWRNAAGSTALYLQWMRLILNAGITIILIAGFIIVNNTLVVNVLDRTKEIGTMRAIGAKKRFISAQCMVETFIMILTSGVIGTFAGWIGTHFINKLKITFTNAFLVQLFGAEALQIHITQGNILKLFILVVAIGFVGWIYPVITAIKVTPVKAMAGGK